MRQCHQILEDDGSAVLEQQNEIAALDLNLGGGRIEVDDVALPRLDIQVQRLSRCRAVHRHVPRRGLRHLHAGRALRQLRVGLRAAVVARARVGFGAAGEIVVHRIGHLNFS